MVVVMLMEFIYNANNIMYSVRNAGLCIPSDVYKCTKLHSLLFKFCCYCLKGSLAAVQLNWSFIVQV